MQQYENYCNSSNTYKIDKIKPSKQCEYENCKTLPAYNYSGEKTALYCTKHKKDGMDDIVSKKCESEWCDTAVGKKYNGYCMRCFMYLFPDKPVARNYKTKEYSVVEFVKRIFLLRLGL